MLTYNNSVARGGLRHIGDFGISADLSDLASRPAGIATPQETYDGGSGNDIHTGTSGADTINGNGGNDILAGGAGGDTIDGGDGADTLYAGAISPAWQSPFFGNNPDFVSPVLDTGSEIDTLKGGAGLDTIYAGYGDIVDGGADLADLLISLQGASSGLTIDFHALDNGGTLTIGGGLISNINQVRWIEGSNFADTLTGSDAGGNYAPIFGRGGDDHLISGNNTGNLYGGEGNDILDAGNHNSGWFYGEGGDDTINSMAPQTRSFGGDGNDTLNVGGYAYGGAGNDTITMFDVSPYSTVAYGNDGNDTINGSESPSMIVGGAGADTLYGNDGNDKLFSAGPDDGYSPAGIDFVGEADTGAERDQLFGGANDDRISIGWGDDADGGTGTNTLALSLIGGSAGVTVNVADLVTGASYAIGGGTIVNFQKLDYLWGTNFADTITMSATAGTRAVYGMGGNDTINGTDGADEIHGGAGADTIHAGDGNDVIAIDAAGEVAAGEVIDGGAGSDVLRAVFNPQGADIDLSGATLTGIETLETQGGNRFGITAATLSGVTTLNGNFYFTTGGTISLSGIGTSQSISFSLADAGNTLDMTGFTGSGFVVVGGGIGDDTVIGSAGGDNVYAGGGNDTLYGNGGSDILSGEAGDDRLDGGTGADTMLGGTGNDVYVVDNMSDVVTENAGEGIDTIESSVSTLALIAANTEIENLTLTGTNPINALGNGLANILIGNDAANVLNGQSNADRMEGRGGDDRYVVDNIGDTVIEAVGQGNDTVTASISYTLAAGQEIEKLTTAVAGTSPINLTGNEFANALEGNAGANRLDGGAGADSMKGFGGNDTYVVDNAADTVIEAAGGGTDTVTTSVSWTMGAGQEIENLATTNAAGTGAIDLTGNDIANTLHGNAGANVLSGGGGDDQLFGGAGDDTYVLSAGDGNDVVTEVASEGTDTVRTALASYTLGANLENLAFTGAGDFHGTGNAQANTITGGTGNDTLVGGDGDDVIDGGAGADTMVGGTGNDHYFVDRQDDVIYENANEGTDLVTASASYYLYANIENLKLAAGAGDIFGVGNDLDNTIVGNEGANLLLGGAGFDTIHGAAGNDQVYGEAGNDMLFGEAGVDYLIGGDGEDTLDGGADEDALYGQDGNDVLWGGTDFKTDTMVGGNGDDVIHADSGKGDYDLLDGGAGNDSYYVDTYADVTYEAAGGGTDTVYADIAGSGYYLYGNVENLVLTGTTVFGVGNDLANSITGNDGDNFLLGGGGDDFLDGGKGNDSLYGEAGNDTLFGGPGINVISGGDGDDRIDGGGTLDGGDGNDDINVVGQINDSLYGSLVIGGAGNDIIHADVNSPAADNLVGGAGDDTYYIYDFTYFSGPGFQTRNDLLDLVFEDADGGNDTVYFSASDPSTVYYMTANVENLFIGNTYTAYGNDLANHITASTGSDTLFGGAGDDVLNGKTDNDTLWGQDGADHFVFEKGTGKDTVGDFTVGTDKIDLTAFGFSTYADVVAGMSETNGTTTIDLGHGDFVVLQGVAEASLHESDFLLGIVGSAAVVQMAQLVHAQPADDADFTAARSALVHQFDSPHTTLAFGGL